MHLDGLADTADGLGCYGPPERALAVMRDGGAGPFAVVTLIVVLGAQAASLAALAPRGTVGVLAPCRWPPRPGGPAFGWVCRRGVPAARPGGLGATVAGSQPWWVAVAVVGGAGRSRATGWPARAECWPSRWARPWWWLLSRHTARRFGGMTGDVLGRRRASWP